MSCRRCRIGKSASDVSGLGVLGAPGGLELGDLGLGGLIEGTGQAHVLAELAHQGPHVGALVLDGGVVLAQFVLARGQSPDDRIEMTLRRLVPVEVGPQLVSAGDELEEFARASQV